MERLSKIDRLLLESAEGISDPGEQALFLDRVSGGDEAERGRLEKLLAARKFSESFFDFEPFESCEAAEEEAEEIADDETGEIGLRIGRYRLIRRLGEGGCGVVYLAEQETPVTRQVALKLIRVGLGHEEVIARFESERQALAMMDHPGIARVFDAGTTANGHPFFVMQWVAGEKITEFCDKRRLTIRQRLELFVKVCKAVQHAHQKGVIHRDLKPSNVLTALYDGVPQPKIIDFGIAKATGNHELPDGAAAEREPVIGTPNYMSPEQGERGGLDVDTRTDIFSLGVLLCELLTGATPFGPDRTGQMNTMELRRNLAERRPTVPSAILGNHAAGELWSVAACRSSKPRRLARLVAGDLDAIVMKCLEHDRQNRYGSANGLGLDIQRYLDDEPVSAWRANRSCRMRKLLRRNKLAVLAGGIVFIALAAGFGTSTRLFLRELEARRVQSRLRDRAEAARMMETELRARVEAREACAKAAVLVSYNRLEEADAILRETPLSSIPPSMEAANVLRSLGDWNAIRGRWQQAVECYMHLLQANGISTAETIYRNADMVACGPILAESGNLDQYETFREWVIGRFGNASDAADALVAEQVMQSTLLLPAAPDYLRRLEPLRERLERSEFRKAKLKPGWDTEAAGWRAWSLALLEYRRGGFGRSLEWGQLCFDLNLTNRVFAAQTHPLRAMCHYRRHELERAKAELELARECIDAAFAPELPPAYEPFGQDHGKWWDWLQARILFREAVAMIEGAARQ